MSDPNLLRIKEVFVAVRAAPEARRDGILRDLCSGDEGLRREVLSLLGYDRTSPLERPLSMGAVAAAMQAHDLDLTGRQLNGFKIRRLIGRGGMGLVWEGAQEHPHRTVAIKVMRRGIVSRDALRRFRHEVELLGRLQHPGIAQVYEADTFEQDGEQIPYFAMELVPAAQILDEFVAQQGLDIEARVALFVDICDAVHHGHQRGIIHRDLKPGNVLVSADGAPKVIDFGVAKATDSDVSITTMRTQVGELIGTLAYMSPEQCDGDPGALDSRSDVYSLGVMLHELLCQRPPYDIDELSIPAAALVIKNQNPAPLSPSGRKQVGRDLEAVLFKALEKDRERRYSSAAALGADLRRWLAGDPVEARLPGPWRKAVRWTGRHPLLTTGLASLLIAATSLGFTYASLALLARTPARIVVDAASQTAALVSRAGHELKVWDTGTPSRLVCCELVDRPERLGGGRVVVAAGDTLATEPQLAGRVCFFHVEDLEEPYWTSAEAPFDLPEGEPPRETSSTFTPASALVGDLLEHVPGEEVAIAHRLVPFSATCIRVYDLAGKVHYETWNDGAVFDLEVLDDPGRLVVACMDSERRWDERGCSMKDSVARYPAVVLALDLTVRPTFGTFLAREGRILDPTVAWYRWLGPPEHLPALQETLVFFEPLYGQWSKKRHVQAFFRAHPEGPAGSSGTAGLHVILDANGNVVSRYTDDGWKRWQREERIPTDAVFDLLNYSELPSAVPPLPVDRPKSQGE